MSETTAVGGLSESAKVWYNVTHEQGSPLIVTHALSNHPTLPRLGGLIQMEYHLTKTIGCATLGIWYTVYTRGADD